MSDDGEVADFVDGNDDLEFCSGGNKVKCLSTGHEMPASLEGVKAYVNGKKYKKLRDWYSFDFEQFQPYIIPHKKLKKHIFCTLTGVTMPKIPEKVKAHVASKRFTKAKKEHEDSKKALGRRPEKRKKRPEDGEDAAEEEGKPERKRDSAGGRLLKKQKKSLAAATSEVTPAAEAKPAAENGEAPPRKKKLLKKKKRSAEAPGVAA